MHVWFSICCFKTGQADVSEDAASEDVGDAEFWDGVTKPEKSTASQQENEVPNYTKTLTSE